MRKTITRPPLPLLDEDLREDAQLAAFNEEAIAEANLLPGPRITDLEPRRAAKTPRWAWWVAGAFVVAGLALWMHFGVAAAYTFGPITSITLNTNRCVFADGTSVEGRCMWVDDFVGSSVDATKWFVGGSDNGPSFTDNANAILSTDNTGCVAAANATVSGGILSMAVSANARGSCPQKWTANAYYNTNYSSFPTGGATSWDTAWVSQATFSFTYGVVEVLAEMPGGTGPGGDISLQGVNCQQPGGSIGASMAGPIFTGLSGACNWPVNAPEIDLFEYVGSNSTAVSTVYVGNAIGSPSLIGTTFSPPVSYYGKQFGSLGTAYLGGFTVSSPSTTYHSYSVDWRPGSLVYSVDGTVTATVNAVWVPSVAASVYMFAQNLTPTTVGGTMRVKHVHITCPTGVPCTSSGS